ncbi:enolase C-terminal domain-like protein [Halomicrococcus sp. NG-SE-24]|uniref:enolase C-terminal domain-like protein n=1 Tax=Halomicrococcus sp. NG-SE-24 TaxID=3436928 RepID=UPI003D95E4B1
MVSAAIRHFLYSTGITKILAAAASIPLVPHVWGTSVALAASLHLLATVDRESWLEFDRSANPLREELSDDSFTADTDGRVDIPSGPGLGINLDRTAIDQYRVDK